MEFPHEFLDGEACIKFACRQAHEIVELCDSIGQQRYRRFESWVSEYCRDWAWAFIANGCVHVGCSKRAGMTELFWDELVDDFGVSVIQVSDIDALL